MDKEQVIALVRESGLHRNDHTSEQRIEAAERFVTLVAAAEREQCAKLCEAGQLIDYPTIFERAAITKCATAIRARSQS